MTTQPIRASVILSNVKAVTNEETLLRTQMFLRLPKRAAKQCFASLLRKRRNILRETNAASTRYYARAVRNNRANGETFVADAKCF